MVTEMLHAASSNAGEFFQWAQKHATLINTSQTMAETVYNCGNQAKEAQKTLATINTTLDMLPTERVATVVQQHAANIGYLTKDDEKIKEIVGQRWHEGALQYQCKLANGQLLWRDYGLLVGFTLKVHEFLRAESLNKKRQTPAIQAVDGPHMELPALDSDSDSSCNSDDEEISAINEMSEADSMEHDINQAVSQAVQEPFHSQTVQDASRKRKRSASSSISEEAQVSKSKRAKLVFQDVVLENKEVVKPGDIISVNPSNAEKFWLAKVVSVTTQRQLHVQWLEEKKQKSYKLLDWFDNIGVGAVNHVASGSWLKSGNFKLGKE